MLVSTNTRIFQFWGLLYESNWRRYLCLSVTTFLVFTQFIYIYEADEGLDAIIQNYYMLVLWVDTILRGYALVINRKKYEELLSNLEFYYFQLKVVLIII